MGLPLLLKADDTGNPALLLLDATSAKAPKAGDANFPKPSPSKRHNQKVELVRKGDYDLVMIGDSITQSVGEGGAESQPLKEVWDQFYGVRKALNLGYSGYRTENILWNLQNGELDFPTSPKVFTLLIGTNNTDDQHYKTTHSGEQVFEGVKAIVALIRQRHPQSKIVLQAILPCGGPNDRTAFRRKYNRSEEGIAANRKANELMQTWVDGKSVFWSDQSAAFLRPDGSINADHMPDMVHPNADGATARATLLEPLLKQLLGE